MRDRGGGVNDFRLDLSSFDQHITCEYYLRMMWLLVRLLRLLILLLNDKCRYHDRLMDYD